MQSASDKKIDQLVDDVLKAVDKKEVDFIVSSLITRLVFSLTRAETALRNVKDNVRSCRAGDGDVRNWEECAMDCEDIAQDGISDLLCDLFGE